MELSKFMSAVVTQLEIAQTFGFKIPLKTSVTVCALDLTVASLHQALHLIGNGITYSAI